MPYPYSRYRSRRYSSFKRRRTYKKAGSLNSFFPNRMSRSFTSNFRSPNTGQQWRRALKDCIIYCDASDNLRFQDADGVDCSYLVSNTFNVPAATDAGTNLKQFGFAANVSLWDVKSYTDFISLFPLCKLNKVEWRITYEAGDSAQTYPGGPATQSPGCPHLYWSWNPYDQTPPTDIGDVNSNSNCKDSILSNSHTVGFAHSLWPIVKPVGADGTASGTAYVTRNMWLSTQNDIPHCSTKFWVRNFGGTLSGARIRVQPYLYFTTKLSY